MKRKGRTWLGLLLCCFLVVAAASLESERLASKVHALTVQVYPARGEVERVEPDRRQVTIHHQEIPGYMMEMTMDFPVKDAADLQGISPGDTVVFNLVVDKTRAWVESIQRTGPSKRGVSRTVPASVEAKPELKLKPGEAVPDVALLAEDGRTIHLADYRGSVVVFTFFFTRCPLPNYCPLMNQNLAETRKLLLAGTKKSGHWQLLSISFDAEFDRPENLSSYAATYRGGDADRWLFVSASPTALAALGPALGLMVMGQEGSYSHNLRTVVMDPQGRLYRQFNDSLWTPRQLADAIFEASDPLQGR